MKIIKKVLAALLCVGLLASGVTFASQAANGAISFSDPSTAVGEMVDVKCVIKSSGGNLGDVSLTLSYDSSALRFDSGDGVSGGNGTLEYTNAGGSDEVSFTMTFQALTEGSSKVTIANQSIKSSAGAAWNMDEGDSTVKIAEGDSSKIVQEDPQPATTEGASSGDSGITVGGVSYELSSDFADTEVPDGYERVTVNFEGTDWTMVVNNTTGVHLAYLVDANKTGRFFYYDDSKATFSPYEIINISDDTAILIVSDDSLELPSYYVQTTMKLNGQEFVVWQNTNKDGFYLVYAINANGKKGFYQYDNQENTYQRYEVEQVEETTEKTADTILDKIQKVVDKYFKIFIIALAVLFGLLLLRLLVVRVKLRNRDIELDDLYDEYGIDMEDAEPVQKKEPKNKSKKKASKKRVIDEDDFDDYEEDDEDKFYTEEIDLNDYDEDDDYDDESDEENDAEEDFEETNEVPLRTVRFDDFNTVTNMGLEEIDEDVYNGGYDDDEEMIDDLDALLDRKRSGEKAPVQKKPEKKRSHAEDDDAFKVDIIDLD